MDREFVALVKSSASRKGKAADLLLAYEDQQADKLKATLAGRWSRPEDFSLLALPLVRRVTDARVQAYRTPPKRSAKGVAPELLTQVYSAFGVDAALKRASRLAWLLGVVGIQAGWGQSGPWLAVIPPNLLDAICADNNPAAPLRVIVTHNVTGRPEDVEYSDWTASDYTRRNYRGQSITVDSNKDNRNPYGRIPVVLAQGRWHDSEVFPPIGDSLGLAQAGANELLMTLWRSAVLQSFGVPWATGVKAGTALEVGPDRAVTLPDGAKFDFAHPQAPLGDLLSTIQFLLQQTAAANSISTDVFRLDGKAESGAAKQMERADLQEARADDIGLWRRHEDALFQVIRAVWNTHRPDAAISESATLAVNFAEAPSHLTEAERLDNGQRKVDSGVWSPVDLALDLDPDSYASRDDALSSLISRREETAALGAGGFAGPSFEVTQ